MVRDKLPIKLTSICYLRSFM
ncbi:hypothetical protein Pint_25271 [Pistacia integerrima]|uniref:Uncharacterized protein n=1 Tax=Pistacia integerrima TaxID=434235 RepID=A0ACC0YCC9_9ROSI|nr:hypothetical protein Pint_25271 [Pistacia integerrima]